MLSSENALKVQISSNIYKYYIRIGVYNILEDDKNVIISKEEEKKKKIVIKTTQGSHIKPHLPIICVVVGNGVY